MGQLTRFPSWHQFEVQDLKFYIQTAFTHQKKQSTKWKGNLWDGRKHGQIMYLMGFSSFSTVKNLPAVQEMQKTQVQSLGWKNPLEEGMETHSSIIA